MRSVLDIHELSVEEIYELINTALDMEKNPEKYQDVCKHKKIATLFFEPSTRTRMSFEAAMLELGGDVISMTGAQNSSASKGESVADTAKVVTNYVDIIAMRHPKEGSAYIAATNSGVPVINAGDGGHSHPTQTLADLLTIYKEKGRLDHLTIGLCGDLKYGRTVHSLIHAMSRYEGNKFVLIAPKELEMPSYVKTDVLEKNGIEYVETTDLEGSLPELDMLYMTRVQRERFDSEEEYQRLKDSYILTTDKMDIAPKDMIVLHPLPRVNEIAVAIDEDPRACYFQQTLNGKRMRAALILKLIKDAEAKPEKYTRAKVTPVETDSIEELPEYVKGPFKCKNTKCIVTTEQELPQIFKLTDRQKKVYRCIYCEMQA